VLFHPCNAWHNTYNDLAVAEESESITPELTLLATTQCPGFGCAVSMFNPVCSADLPATAASSPPPELLLQLLLLLSALHLGSYLALLQCCGGSSARGNKRLTSGDGIRCPLERTLQPHARSHPASPKQRLPRAVALETATPPPLREGAALSWHAVGFSVAIQDVRLSAPSLVSTIRLKRPDAV
jgi:hypothetical protein